MWDGGTKAATQSALAILCLALILPPKIQAHDPPIYKDPAVAEKMKNGDTAARKEILRKMFTEPKKLLVLDDAFLDAFITCADDADSGDVSWKKLADDIGYIYFRRIKSHLIDDLDQAVEGLHSCSGLIIDVRGNSGGGFDAARSFRNFDLNDSEEPDRPRFTGPIAILIDARCISAGEGWASWFVANDRARLFGTATAGASSRKKTVDVCNGLFRARFSVKAYRGFLDRPIERIGLEPDAHVIQTAEDLIAGIDTVLEAARKYLLTSSK